MIVAYHPECPHCQTIVPYVERLNQFIQNKNIPVNLITINMSKTMQFSEELNLTGFPTIRLYKPGKSSASDFVQFDKDSGFAAYVQFLKENGVDVDGE